MTDLRTIETIIYGSASAVRAELNPDICRELATQIPELTHHSLAAVADYFRVPHENAHQAKEAALTSGLILQKMLERTS